MAAVTTYPRPAPSTPSYYSYSFQYMYEPSATTLKRGKAEGGKGRGRRGTRAAALQQGSMLSQGRGACLMRRAELLCQPT